MVKVSKAKLDDMRAEVKSALRALKEHGHSEGCSCKLCLAGRWLMSAFASLEEVLTFEEKPVPKKPRKKKDQGEKQADLGDLLKEVEREGSPCWMPSTESTGPKDEPSSESTK